MGFSNPDIPWSEFERKLSGRPSPAAPRPGHDEGPGSHKRKRYEAKVERPVGPVVPYAELHAHSNFSFLDGASDPESLIEEAVRLGLHALALTDHDGFYGVARFAEAAQAYDLKTVYGAELSIGLTTPQAGIPDPEGHHLLVLARGVEGYHRLARAITEAQLRGDEKGRPLYDLDELAETADGHWMIMTGCRKGLVRKALQAHGREQAAAELDQLVALFGQDQLVVELIDHGLPTDSKTNDQLASLAVDHGLRLVASNNVHYATPKESRLAAAMAAVRARRSLAEMDGWLPPTGAHVRSGAEMERLFRRYRGVVAASVQLADELAFDLQVAKPKLPKLIVPDGHNPTTWLRELVRRGADELYPRNREVAQKRIERELKLIEAKGFEGYFLIVHDMVEFARDRGIICQGRGSAASSVVCFALKITAVDPIKYKLPFERFLSENREEEPDIDVDFDSDRREEVIQEVYRRYGRRNAAQVANVISYRPKSAIRDMAKALGFSTGQQDAWSKQIDSWGAVNAADVEDVPPQVVALAAELMGAPRHLGIHSGGMVLTEQPVGEVCPIERGRMDNRTVLQWDKDSCAWMGLVKFDFLGLGIMSAIRHCFDLAAEHTGESWTLASIPKEEAGVYDMLCRADSIGVFQVESRAQIGTLPRLQPREFYDLVVEIALIRPGPIQGGAVHPYIRRATGKEEITYMHEALIPVLERTKGVPLFQEQLMEIAVTLGNCTRNEADLLRRAMGSKRGVEKIERLKDKLYQGMTDHQITGDLADEIYNKIEAFAQFGFAESHALSFALLVYATSWLKLHYPAAFLAGLLRAQPMGFYSPQSLVADARRHGVSVLRPDLRFSGVDADLERLESRESGGSDATGMDSCLDAEQPKVEKFDRSAPDRTAEHRRDGRVAVRLGLSEVQGLGREAAERIVQAREQAPFANMTDLSRRAGLSVKQAEALATAGAFDGFGLSRRQALWNAGYAASEDQLEGVAIDAAPPTLPGMSPVELTLADIWATKISPDDHPIAHLRDYLNDHAIVPIGRLGEPHNGTRLRVAGLVTHRQRPATAGGVTFINLEDETGMLNVVCSGALWACYRRVARNSAGLVIRGKIEHAEGVTNLIADRLDRLSMIIPEAIQIVPAKHASRDFR